MNSWLIVVLTILICSYLLDLVVTHLNTRALEPTLPAEFESYYEKDEYQRSQLYTKERSKFSIIENSFSTIITIGFILVGGFNYVDLLARNQEFGEIITGLLFTAILGSLSFFVRLPFSIYSTFVIEEEFGFNKTTVKTFLLDILKGTLLLMILGGPLLSLIFWFFISTGDLAWVYCWLGVILFSIVMQYLAPVFIMPLFNKFTPIDEGSLKDAIQAYAKSEQFALQGIFTMDGSKRSSKLNAFFTGFGKFRKIVFFDTLLEKLSEKEIIAVLAHEMGHYKLKHILKMMLASIIQTGVMFYLLSLFLTYPQISLAFGLEQPSIYSSLFFFGFLYSPISMLVSIVFNIFSRKHEYEADAYAVETTKSKDSLISGLKKLSLANLSNLTPHPLYVFLHYSHPPILERINRLQSISPIQTAANANSSKS